MHCIMDALMALEGWHVEGLNVKSAYLYGKLDKEIYIQQPEGFVVKGQEHKVICLNHTLYRLKQSGLVWWHTLVQELEKMGFKRIHANTALFVYCEKGDRFVIALVYVDNARLYGPLKAFVQEINNCIKQIWASPKVPPSVCNILYYMCAVWNYLRIYCQRMLIIEGYTTKEGQSCILLHYNHRATVNDILMT
jgi:hypothetical protein